MGCNRKFIHIQGQSTWCNATCQILIAELPNSVENIVYYGTNKLEFGNKIKLIDRLKKRSEIENHLGSENSVLVYDSFAGFNPDLFCALVGLIKSPGLIIFLSPAIEKWTDYADPDYAGLCSHPFQKQDVKGRFIAYFIDKLIETQTNDFLTLNQNSAVNSQKSLNQINSIIYKYYKEPTLIKRQIFSPSSGQRKVVTSIRELVNAGTTGIVVVHGNRGRGKSTIIGQALTDCLKNNNTLRITIVSQHKINVAPIFDQISLQFDSTSLNVNFLPPDEYLRKQNDPDILVVDEAATIPLGILKQLVSANYKTIIATTTDGYEGSGMGFCAKFQNYIFSLKAPVSTIELKTPFRWSKNDPVENFIFSVFFPNKLPLESLKFQKLPIEQLNIQQVDRNALIGNPEKIQLLFSLLAQAHYRTSPDDLRYMLDAPDVEIWTAEFNHKPVTAMLVSNEGLIGNEFQESIWLGKRRLNGHLVPQILSNQNGFKQAINFSYKRVVRIATLKQFRNQGIASLLINRARIAALGSPARTDFIAVSYGFEPQLHEFWEKLGFKSVRLGHRKNASSGLRSVLMLKPLNDSARDFCHKLEQRFKYQGIHAIDFPQPNHYQLLMNNVEQDQLDVYSFAFGHRQYSNCRAALSAFANFAVNSKNVSKLLSQQQSKVLTFKVLQNKNWTDAAKLAGFTGKTTLTRELRDVYAILYKAVWGNKS